MRRSCIVQHKVSKPNTYTGSASHAGSTKWSRSAALVADSRHTSDPRAVRHSYRTQQAARPCSSWEVDFEPGIDGEDEARLPADGTAQVQTPPRFGFDVVLSRA